MRWVRSSRLAAADASGHHKQGAVVVIERRVRLAFIESTQEATRSRRGND